MSRNPCASGESWSEPAIAARRAVVKIYIMTDLEGPAGVNRWIQTREGETPEKAAAMRLLTAEVNAAIEGIHQADPAVDIIVKGKICIRSKSVRIGGILRIRRGFLSSGWAR